MATAPPRPNPPVLLLGAPRRLARDAYHAFLTRSWWFALSTIALTFLAMNVAFALAYQVSEGVHGAAGFIDYFWFSVQTSGTIGYGAEYPSTTAANALVTGEAVASLILTALATGLVFSKFSRLTSRMRFTREAVITMFDGVPTLMIRLGNERGNAIVEAELRVVFNRREVTKEGERFYRSYDLALARDRAPALTRSWTVMHPITEWSPLSGMTAEQLLACDGEISISVLGLDDVAMQPVHARHTYEAPAIRYGHRFADIVSERDDGTFVVDLGKFDTIEPAAAPLPT